MSLWSHWTGPAISWRWRQVQPALPFFCDMTIVTATARVRNCCMTLRPRNIDAELKGVTDRILTMFAGLSK
jgi:hypothetical protein